MKIAIIGAGIAGLTVARELASQHDIVLFDKARGPGGRLASRRRPDTTIDHGTIGFSADDRNFVYQLEQWQQAGVLSSWRPIYSGDQGDEQLWLGVPRMSALTRFWLMDSVCRPRPGFRQFKAKRVIGG